MSADTVLALSVGVLLFFWLVLALLVVSDVDWARFWHYWQVRAEQTWTVWDRRFARLCYVALLVAVWLKGW